MPERTVTFVDLAGFTALTETHGDGDADADELVERFVELARGAVGELFETCYAESGFPVPRAGMHHGPVVDDPVTSSAPP